MSYSGSVATWISGSTVTATQKRGWKSHIWTAVNTTTAEPAPDSVDWSLDDPLKLSALSLNAVHDPRDFLKTKIQGITIIDTHVSRPPEVLLAGIRFERYINPPYLIISNG